MGQNFCWVKKIWSNCFFLAQKFFLVKFFWVKFFLGQIFLGYHFFWVDIFLDQHFFVGGGNFFSWPNLFLAKNFFRQKIFRPNFFQAKLFSDKICFSDKKKFRPKFWLGWGKNVKKIFSEIFLGQISFSDKLIIGQIIYYFFFGEGGQKKFRAKIFQSKLD